MHQKWRVTPSADPPYELIAQLGSQPATASEISRVIGRPRDVVMQRLDELLERGYVEHRGNRYKMTHEN